jgi:hypothetical protein
LAQASVGFVLKQFAPTFFDRTASAGGSHDKLEADGCSVPECQDDQAWEGVYKGLFSSLSLHKTDRFSRRAQDKNLMKGTLNKDAVLYSSTTTLSSCKRRPCAASYQLLRLKSETLGFTAADPIRSRSRRWRHSRATTTRASLMSAA